MFLGGIIIIVIYMTSLAANEKASVSFSGTRGILFLSLRMLLFLDSNWTYNDHSSYTFVRNFYNQDSVGSVIFCFIILLLTIIRVVKLIKLEEGPMVKRL
jgi:hypothetical protein